MGKTIILLHISWASWKPCEVRTLRDVRGRQNVRAYLAFVIIHLKNDVGDALNTVVSKCMYHFFVEWQFLVILHHNLISTSICFSLPAHQKS